jgi:hypothetical protein
MQLLPAMVVAVPAVFQLIRMYELNERRGVMVLQHACWFSLSQRYPLVIVIKRLWTTDCSTTAD